MRASRRSLVLASLLVVLAVSLAEQAAAQPGPPRQSPKASLTQVVGNTEIAISYSRPAVRGRDIWGALVPWDKVWRTGANEATTFSFSTDVKIEGKPLPAGKYALFTIPGKDKWTLIFNKGQEQWGAFDHKPADDVLRVDVKPVQSGMQERLEFLVNDFDLDSAEVTMRWENTAIQFAIQIDTVKEALAKAEKELAASPKPGQYVSWARWFQENDAHSDKALAWVQKAVAEGHKSYRTRAVEARLLAKAGRVKEARAAAEAALELAKTDKGPEPIADDVAKLRDEMAKWKG